MPSSGRNGQEPMAGSLPVAIAFDQSAIPISGTVTIASAAVTVADGADVTQGTKADPAASDATSAWSVVAVLKGLFARLTTGNSSTASIDTKTPALGQALAASSTPVVLTALQITALTPPAAITGYALDATVTTTNTEIGGLTETAPATDTASSGLNGRLQRLAQRLTSLLALLPPALGAGGGLKVDGSGTALPVSLASAPTTAVTIADGAAVTVGTKTDAKSTATDGTSTSAISIWKQISASVQALATGTVLAAGTALVGKVGIDQTTPGTTNAIAGDIAAAVTDSSNPVKIGGKAASAAPSAVTAGQRVNALFDLWGRLGIRTGAQAPVASTFTQIHIPASNTQATKTQASAGAGKRNVCTGFTFTLTANGTAPAVTTPVVVSVIDGASGGTTYLWRSNINMPAQAGGIVSFNRSGLWWVGSQATALTLEFSGASGANTYQSVAFDGVVVEE